MVFQMPFSSGMNSSCVSNQGIVNLESDMHFTMKLVTPLNVFKTCVEISRDINALIMDRNT